MSEYTKSVQYLFQIRGTEFALSMTGRDNNRVPMFAIEETRRQARFT